MYVLIGLFLLAHGIAHLVGFAGAFHLSAQIPYKTTLFAGRLDVGDLGERVLGVIWLLAALAFAAAALGSFRRAPWWPDYTLVVALASLALCVVALPEAKIGVVVNLVIVAALVVAKLAGWPIAAP